MSRSHHNSQQQNHGQNSWFMSPNIVNNLFCSPGNNASVNCNNGTFMNNSNINNHLTNLLNNQHHFMPQNAISHHPPPPSPLTCNNAFPSHYHGSNQNFTSQPYSTMFPPMNSHSNSINLGGNGRLLVGQNNHHYQNQSNNPRSIHSNRMNSRMNSNFSTDINQSCKYQPGYGSSEPILNFPDYTSSNKSINDFNDKSNEHFEKSLKSSSNQLITNLKKSSSGKHHTVKGMENIRLDNEGVRSNYYPMTTAASQQLHSPEPIFNSADNSNVENIDKSSFIDGQSPKSDVKFTLDIEEEELIFNGTDIVDINKAKTAVVNVNKKKNENDSNQINSNKVEKSTGVSVVKVIENEIDSEKLKQNSKSVQNPTNVKPCPGTELPDNENNFIWPPQNQNVPFSSNQPSGMINQCPQNHGHYAVTPQNMSNYGAIPQHPGSNFAAAFLASSLGGAHPSALSNVGHKCNVYRQENSFTSTYHDVSSSKLWQYYITNRQTEAMYVRKVQLRNALHMVMSYVFENAGLFIVGSSMNGFGSDSSDMDLCLTITSKDLHQKKEAFVVLNQLVEPLRKCSFIKNLQLIRATVPILKFRDTLAGVDCDLNINNVVGIYNTHLLAMYNRIDWRLRPLGMYIKHWAQKVDLHDASRGRLSTYTLILMLIQYLQAGCNPPVLPCLQSAFPKQFSYDRQVKEVDMRLDLPWEELRSTNTAKLSDLLMGFFEYYVDRFDFSKMAVSIRTGKPIAIEAAIKQLAPHEQLHNVKSFKLFIEEPFSLTNVARSLFDGLVFTRFKRCFRHSLQVMRLKQSLKLMFTLPTSTESTLSNTDCPEPSRSVSNQSLTASNSNQDDNSKTLPLSDTNDNDISEKSDISCLEDDEILIMSNKFDDIKKHESLGTFDDA